MGPINRGKREGEVGTNSVVDYGQLALIFFQSERPDNATKSKTHTEY